MHVKVYRNLHNGKWSVVNMRTGRVCMHADRLTLKDATFVVQPAGNAKVRAQRVKNVHAYVKGTLLTLQEALIGTSQVKYNPYTMTQFMLRADEPIYDAPYVDFTSEGKVYAGWES